MQFDWINKQNNDNLIVFFGGWSFDGQPFKCLRTKDFDVLMFYDYSDLNLPEIPDNKKKKNLIAWSMGVFIAYYLKDKLPEFNKKIAVNGTPYPINNDYGIPVKTFDLTLKYAETGLRGKFYENVFSDAKLLTKYLQNPVQRPIENRVNELIALDKLIKNAKISYDGHFYDLAIVGNFDKIIPTKNQINMWGNNAKLLDCGHFPFYNFEYWDEICKF